MPFEVKQIEKTRESLYEVYLRAKKVENDAKSAMLPIIREVGDIYNEIIMESNKDFKDGKVDNEFDRMAIGIYELLFKARVPASRSIPTFNGVDQDKIRSSSDDIFNIYRVLTSYCDYKPPLPENVIPFRKVRSI